MGGQGGLCDGGLATGWTIVGLSGDNLIVGVTYNTRTEPAWVGDIKSGVPFDASHIYFEHFEVGDQVHDNHHVFDE